jgi:hypothetical protein
MNFSTEDWPANVQMLTKLTRAGSLKWRIVAIDPRSRASLSVGAYEAEFADRTLRLQDQAALGMPPNALRDAKGARAWLDNAEKKWGITPDPSFSVRLVIVDENGAPLFLFPDVPDIIDLLAAVKEQVVDLGSFLEAVKLAAAA